MPSFGSLLKQYLADADSSQSKLASELGIHRNTIGGWMRGDRIPDVNRISEIAHFLYLSEEETKALLRAAKHIPETLEIEATAQGSSSIHIQETLLHPSLQEFLLPVQEVFERVELRKFIGRAWLFDKVQDFLHSPNRDRGVWLLVGDAGAGKTSFLAELVQRIDCIHYFAELSPGDVNLQRSLMSIAVQLIDKFKINPFFESQSLPSTLGAFPDFLTRLLYSVSAKLQSGERVVLVLDGLDEAGIAPEGNVLGLPRHLPKGVYIIASQRYQPVVLDIEPEPLRIDLRLDDPHNRRDLVSYLYQSVETPELSGALASNGFTKATFVRLLARKSAGNWMYVRFVLIALQQGKLLINDVKDIPVGLVQYYARYWAQWRRKEDWNTTFAPILATLAVSYEPIGINEIILWSGSSADKYSVWRLLKEEWGPFIQEVRNTTPNASYRFIHTSVDSFFKGEVLQSSLQPGLEVFIEELRERSIVAHEKIVDILTTAIYSSVDTVDAEYHINYAIKHLFKHLQVLDRKEQMYTLLSSGRWQELLIRFDPSRCYFARGIDVALVTSTNQIKSLSSREDLLAAFATNVVFSLAYENVNKFIKNIPPSLFGVLAQLGDIELAKRYADFLNSIDIHKYIVMSLEARGFTQKAQEWREEFNVEDEQSDATSEDVRGAKHELKEVLKKLADGKIEDALAISRSIDWSDDKRTEASIFIGVALVKNGEVERAFALLEEVGQKLGSDSNITRRGGSEKTRSKVGVLAFFAKALYDDDEHDVFNQALGKSLELVDFLEDKLDVSYAILNIATYLSAKRVDGKHKNVPEKLLEELLIRAETAANQVDDYWDRATCLTKIAKLWVKLQNYAKAISVTQVALEMARKMINYKYTWFDTQHHWSNEDVWGVDIMEKLPGLFFACGEDQRAYSVLRETLEAVERIGKKAFGGQMIPEDIVRSAALNGSPTLVKRVVEEILTSPQRESSLWISANALIDNGSFEEALILIEDGDIQPFRPRYEILSVLTKASLLLLQNRQYERALSICHKAISAANQPLPLSHMALLLGGLGCALYRSECYPEAFDVFSRAINTVKHIPQILRWERLSEFVEMLIKGASEEQIFDFAEWLFAVIESRRNTFEESEYTNVSEEWVDVLRYCATVYAAANREDKAIATIEKHGVAYGRGRRYFYSQAVVFLTLIRRKHISVNHTSLTSIKSALIDMAKEALRAMGGRDNDDDFWNGQITDSVVSLARIGEIDLALDFALSIMNEYYRALSIVTIAHDSTYWSQTSVPIELIERSMLYCKNVFGPTKWVMLGRGTKAIIRFGQLDKAVDIIISVWSQDSKIYFDSEANIKLNTRDKESHHRLERYELNETVAVLCELVSSGSHWGLKALVNLFLQVNVSYWSEIGFLMSIFTSPHISSTIWQRVNSLFRNPGLNIQVDYYDNTGIPLDLSDLGYLSRD